MYISTIWETPLKYFYLVFKYMIKTRMVMSRIGEKSANEGIQSWPFD
jgi:hypothetical protein